VIVTPVAGPTRDAFGIVAVTVMFGSLTCVAGNNKREVHGPLLAGRARHVAGKTEKGSSGLNAGGRSQVRIEAGGLRYQPGSARILAAWLRVG